MAAPCQHRGIETLGSWAKPCCKVVRVIVGEIMDAIKQALRYKISSKPLIDKTFLRTGEGRKW
jgi:hypothetical protein